MIFNLGEIILFFEVILLVHYGTLLDYLEEIAPPYLEAEWDNSGVQVDPCVEEVNTLLVGLDPTKEFIATAARKDVDLLICHHPLIFSPIERLDRDTPTGQKIFSLIRNQLGLISIHTPFDQSSRGLSQALANKLDLDSTEPLMVLEEGNLLKLEVFVPKPAEESLTKALLNAGAGKLGSYEGSYYRSEVEGRFRPLESADPHTGERGREESTEEIRLNFLLSRGVRDRVISALTRTHPYEDPGYSLEATERKEPGVGLGRIGEWDEPKDLDEIITHVSGSLSVNKEEITVTGDPVEGIVRVAASPGAGGSAVIPAIKRDAELLITGELDYHERLEAREAGLNVIEVGHYHSEKIFSPWIEKLLRDHFNSDKIEIELYEEGS